MQYMLAANRKHELSAASSSSDAVANTPKAEFSEVGPVFDALTILQRRCMSKDEKRTLLALMEVAETSASDGPSGQKQTCSLHAYRKARKKGAAKRFGRKLGKRSCSFICPSRCCLTREWQLC